MRKTVFVLLTLVCIVVQAQKPMSLDPIQKQWTTKNIKVSGGANILQLVSAFQQTWPTYSGRELLKFSKSKAPYDNTDKIVDIKNGYVFYSEDSPDAESDEIMSACVWNRQNGHKLFAITFCRMEPSELTFICFYDYDPKSLTLVPEKSLSKLFTPSFPNYSHRYHLPQKGKNLQVGEYYGAIQIVHKYTWDGMKPARPQIFIDQMDLLQGEFKQNFPVVLESPFTQYALMDIDHDGHPELLLQSDDGDYKAVYSIYLTVSLLAAQSDRRFLKIYNGAVSHSGTCGALCMSEVYVLLKNSDRKSTLIDLQEYDNEADEYGDSNYTLDNEPIAKEKAEKIIKSLGEPLEPKLQWKKLMQ